MKIPNPKFSQPWFGSTLTTLAGGAIGLFLFFSILGVPLEHLSYDLPFLLFRGDTPRDDVVIIELDDESYEVLQQNRSAFDGALHAALLRRLAAEGASIVVFDIIFADQNPPPPGDELLAAAMRSHGKVVLAGDVPERDQALSPGAAALTLRPVLTNAAAGWGIARIEPGEAPRRLYTGTPEWPSLAWRAAELVNAPITKPDRARENPLWINYYGQEPFLRLSYYRALDPAKTPGFSFRGKAVFIGRGAGVGYAGEQKDQFRYPWTPLNGRYPFGVEMHALTFANLVQQDALRRYPLLAEVALLLLVGTGLGFFLPRTPPLAATAIAIGTAAAIATLGCLTQLLWNRWFGWMIPVAVQIPLLLIWAIGLHALKSYLETTFLKRSLGFYVSPYHVDEILRQPELLKPGVAQREASILFSDIAQFSKIAERMLPDDLAQLLNDYYETAISSIHETGGTVMNLIGDAILAIWNAPQLQEDHQARACRAAALLSEKLVVFDSTRRHLRLQTRVGLHSGPVSVGNIGSSSHFDYTVIGQNVNLASRLEGLNKQLGTSVLATRQIQKAVDGKIRSRFVGHFRFKGFDQVVEVHELLGSQEQTALSEGWLADFAQGLHSFQRLEFNHAMARFLAVLRAKPEDGPTRFYLSKLEEFSAHPPAAGWLGEIDLGEK